MFPVREERFLTCGRMSTRRLEVWHAVTEQYADLKSRVGLFDSICKLIPRQHVLKFECLETNRVL